MSPTAQPYPDIAEEVAHSPAPDGRMEEANSDVRQPGRMKSDETDSSITAAVHELHRQRTEWEQSFNQEAS